MKVLRLSKHHPERIRIGPAITVTIVRSEGGQIRVGIDAPADLPITTEPDPGPPDEPDQAQRPRA